MRHPNKTNPVKTNKGGALLTALFIMTLVAIVATAMSIRLQLDIYRTRLINSHDQLYLAAQLVTFWSMNELNDKNKTFNKANEQGLVAQLPAKMEKLYKQVTIKGELYDLQGRINLNNLTDKRFIPTLIALQKNLQINNDNQNKAISLSVFDWLSTYNLGRGKDNYMSYYLGQKPPYLPSHQLMQSTTEFRLIKDVSATQYQALQPYIIAVPDATAINLNTAPRVVLKSLGGGISDSRLEELLAARGTEGIKRINDITELLKKMNLSSGQVTIQSQYFLSVAYASSDDFNLVVYTVYKRSLDAKNKAHVGIVRESINSFN
ncbi:MAG: general secretion pathway protein GspK [Legionella sp.]|nr:MAG: general secretion pathway protein GspK [Legionella sp.]